MGLITNILTFPLAPVRGTVWVLDQVLLTAEREYYDPEPVRQELRRLEQQLLDESITPSCSGPSAWRSAAANATA